MNSAAPGPVGRTREVADTASRGGVHLLPAQLAHDEATRDSGRVVAGRTLAVGMVQDQLQPGEEVPVERGGPAVPRDYLTLVRTVTDSRGFRSIRPNAASDHGPPVAEGILRARKSRATAARRSPAIARSAASRSTATSVSTSASHASVSP